MALPRPRYQAKKKRRRKSKFKQGFYQPNNPEKFKPSQDTHMNEGPIPYYRSGWELKFYAWCDNNNDIEYWGTESTHIKYISPKDGQPHRYFPDIFIKFLDGRKMIIEIKPAKQVKSAINQAKFEAANRYADQIGAKFVVITEKELKAWNLI
ncbi:MAG: TnsA endonuclease N-terminal domain-containing protein [Clostridiales bacterium]|nr:TnsA endonuclease N-terminal domain-containing protein [Clostridiales bacterium]